MLERARNGDRLAREALVRENLALVKYIVKRFAGRGVDCEDLFQYGCLGLLKAVDRFDPSFDVRFSTYAVPVILGEIRRFLRDDGPIHVSRTLRELSRRAAAFTEDFLTRNGRDPAIDEIASALQVGREELVLALNSRSRVRSLDEPVRGDDELRLGDVLGVDSLRGVDRRLLLRGLLRELSEEERAIIVRRYFKRHTQTQIAADLGVSQVQVSRMEKRILARLRQLAGEGCAEEG